MHIILVDTHRKPLMPLSLTRPVSHLLIGVDRIIDKWKRHTRMEPGVLTATYLGANDEAPREGREDHTFWVSASVLPTAELVETLATLDVGQVLVKDGFPVAARRNPKSENAIHKSLAEERSLTPADFAERTVEYSGPLDIVRQSADIFSLNDAVLRRDYAEIVGSAKSQSPGEGVVVRGNDLHVAPGANIRPCFLNTETGPIHIGKNAEIMEGAMIRGPFSLGESAVVKMGAKIYGATTIGAHCRVGGELNNVVMHAYSNKGHDGFLGNSVLGSWCNLGADTNTSNLKNNYGPVRVWSYESEDYPDSGRQFHGLIMGDHSKTGINTMLNTGTVIGVCSNVFGGGFPPKFIPSFRWGSIETGFVTHLLPKAVETARTVMKRRQVDFSDRDLTQFETIAKRDERYRM